MELDFKYKQYLFSNTENGINDTEQKQEENDSTSSSSSTYSNKPHSEILEFFDKNKETFDFSQIKTLMRYITSDTDLVLKNGIQIKIIPEQNSYYIAIRHPNGNKFVGIYTDTNDSKEFDKLMGKLE